MYGKWLSSTINGMRNIRRWEGKQKILIVNDSYPSVFYRKYISCTNNTFCVSKWLNCKNYSFLYNYKI